MVSEAPTASSPAPRTAAASSPAPQPGLAPAPAPLPAHVGPYRVVGQLGAGGVGVVYEAVDAELGRPVAVKVLRDASAANVARFRREARAMSRVNHPNVATVYEVGEADGRGYIAMELVRGQTLRQWLDQDPGWSDILAIVHQAGAGLVAAHAVGLVHRDFKPDNILVGDDGRVRVVDFGLAKHHAELTAEFTFDRQALARELADGGITRTGALMGTPAYMAPEQFTGQGDARSDQFALCVVLYEALYGRLPFEGETAEDLFHATTAGRLRPWPRETTVPMALRAVLRRGLSADAERRFESMAALLDALTHAVTQDEARPRRRSRTKGTRSWRWRIVGAATGLLLAAGQAALGDDDASTTSTASHTVQSPDDDATEPRPSVERTRTEAVPARAEADARVDTPRPRRPAQS